MAEKLERNGARQKGRIHENTCHPQLYQLVPNLKRKSLRRDALFFGDFGSEACQS